MPSFDHTQLQAKLNRLLATFSKVPMDARAIKVDGADMLEIFAGELSVCGVQIWWNRVHVYREGEIVAEMNLSEAPAAVTKVALSILITQLA